MKSRISNLISKAQATGDRQLARELRKIAAESLLKISQEEHGILQHPSADTVEYTPAEHVESERGGEPENRQKLYGVGIPDYKKTDLSVREYNRSLSTRYSPDRIGVQARRIADGVYQDPYTNKVYDWNAGFKTEEGEEFAGGGVSLQTDIASK
jgi:hypothetical protein